MTDTEKTLACLQMVINEIISGKTSPEIILVKQNPDGTGLCSITPTGMSNERLEELHKEVLSDRFKFINPSVE